MIALFLVGILVCLSRNNGVYVVIPSMVCLILYMQKEKKQICYFYDMSCSMLSGDRGLCSSEVGSGKRISEGNAVNSISTDSQIYKRVSG